MRFLFIALVLSTLARAIDAPALESGLSASFPARITRVSVLADKVVVSGNVPTSALLADIPMDLPADDPARFELTTPVKPDAAGQFTLTLPRLRARGGVEHDRLLSRWQIVSKNGDGFTPLSHARYPDEVTCRSPELPPAVLKSKKGLGGWDTTRIPGELAELGISAVTVNMMVHSLLSLEPGPGLTPLPWHGRTYYTRDAVVDSFDKTFREAADNQAMVSVILLIANPAKDANPSVKVLGHPDAKPEGIFAMPNVTSPDGLALYAAIMDFMAERWSRPDGKYGRVHHWILHNEVDAGKVWTNAGDKPDIVYMDLYQRSMRLVDLISRQYDPNMQPFISLTHHWADKGEPGWYGSKRLLELLSAFCKAEGDFPWALAYHPYPQDLTNPRTWEDKQATFTFGTAKITPHNIEVLDAWMKLPAMLHQGKVRPVHLSENGFNSRGYSEKSLADQAAGMAYAWKKITPLSSIQVWHYHNWIDNRGEGGLRIGLRKFPDEPGDPLDKKPIWHLYKAFATPDEDSAAAPFLPVIGLRSWQDAIHAEQIR